MKKLILAFVCFGLITAFAQNPLQKITPKLQLKMESDSQSGKYLVWIYFTDKGNDIDGYYINPESVVSKKSLDRRAKVFSNDNLIDFSDLPLNQNYINHLVQNGFTLKQKSKWFNAVSGYANQNEINQIALNAFVNKIDIVGTYAKRVDDHEFEQTDLNNDHPLQPQGINSLNYGNSFTQLNQINVPAVHDSGFTGTGITICVLDAGFGNLGHEVFQNMNIIATYDFVNGTTVLASHFHGTATLSLIGGFKEGQLIGPAFNADFILARTEDAATETPVEEDNWIAGIEWADSIGVDVTSTSLGYIDFDPPFTSYTWQTMDGNTAVITIAADLAVKKGIVVVNSAGNEGSNSSHNTLGAPADGDSVITIGSVDSQGDRAYYSSVGPTVDGRIKPDLMAMGMGPYIATLGSTSSYAISSIGGTSFSCPLAAGVCALILQRNPSLTSMEVLQVLRSTASRSSNPDNLYGWGIINALSAINSVIVPVELTLFNGVFNGDKVNLQWITATELNNYGFEIERRNDFSAYEQIGFVNGNGTSTNRVTYNYVDENLSSSRYYYRLKQLDFDGSFEYSSEISVDIEQLKDFKLFQNYPNPFNPTTSIKYYVPVQGQLIIGLFDILGNEIKTLVDNEVRAGSYEISVDGSNLASGMYFVKMIAQRNQQVIKISLIK